MRRLVAGRRGHGKIAAETDGGKGRTDARRLPVKAPPGATSGQPAPAARRRVDAGRPLDEHGQDPSLGRPARFRDADPPFQGTPGHGPHHCRGNGRGGDGGVDVVAACHPGGEAGVKRRPRAVEIEPAAVGGARRRRSTAMTSRRGPPGAAGHCGGAHAGMGRRPGRGVRRGDPARRPPRRRVVGAVTVRWSMVQGSESASGR